MLFKIKLLTAAAITLAILLGGSAARAELKAGAGINDITPKPGCYLGGYYMLTERSRGVHDPLHVRALVIDDGNKKIAVITMDLIIMGGVMAGEIKDKINAEFGIPKENINVSVEHTHTGPEGYYEEFGKYPKEYLPDMKLDIENKSVDAVRQAVKSLAPATVGYEQFDINGFNHNRRESGGPADKTAVLLVIKNTAGKPIAGFLNFAAHPTVVPTDQMLISGEWTGMFQTQMEEKMGAGSVFLYLQGASGNLSPDTRDVGDGWAQAKDLADRLTAEVFPRLNQVKTAPDVTVDAASREYELKIRTRKSASEYNNAIPAKIKEIQASTSLTADQKKHLIGNMRERAGVESFMQMLFPTMKRIKDRKTRTTVEAMRIGGLLLVAFPGEPITEIGIDIRKQLSPSTVAVLGYSNDHLGYLTTKVIYDGGGYEAGMGLVMPDSTDELVNGALEMAKSFTAKN